MKINWRPPSDTLWRPSHLAYQRELVAQLEYDGHDTAQATRLLKEFEEVLAVHSPNGTG